MTIHNPAGEGSAALKPNYRRQRPGRLMRLLFKLPAYFYWGPFARLFAWRHVLRLTTVGRKSGIPRRTCLSFMPVEGSVVVFAGWGVIAHWYRNIERDPRVQIDIGPGTIYGHAYPIENPGMRQAMMLRMAEHSIDCGPPPAIRPLLAATGIFDYEADIQLAVDQGGDLPVVEIVPIGSRPVVAGPVV